MTVIVSCKKDESPDIKGNPDTMFFTSNANLGNMPGNSVSYSLTNIPDATPSGWQNLTSGIPQTIKIPVYATKPVSREVTVTAEFDNSLVAAYNAANNTAYTELPAGILSAQSLSVKIPEGQTTAVDSLTIGVSAADLKTLTAPAYMTPIKLTTVSDESVGKIASNDAIRIVYVVLNVELRQIRYLATAADVTGTLQSKVSWVTTFNPAPTAQVGNILDGSTATLARWTAPTPPVMVDLDMQAAKNVTGFRLYTSTSSTTSPTQMDVSVSDDGITYRLIGSPLRANLTYTSGYTYVLFYRPVKARYLRLNVSYSTSTSTQNGRMAELDVYAN
jgi:hypothetical protein